MKILSDSSFYSRARLGPSLFTPNDLLAASAIEEGSKRLLVRLWQIHPDILKHHEKAGRQVVRP